MSRAVHIEVQASGPTMPIPGIGWLAYLKAPDEKTCGVMHADTEAA